MAASVIQQIVEQFVHGDQQKPHPSTTCLLKIVSVLNHMLQIKFKKEVEFIKKYPTKKKAVKKVVQFMAKRYLHDYNVNVVWFLGGINLIAQIADKDIVVDCVMEHFAKKGIRNYKKFVTFIYCSYRRLIHNDYSRKVTGVFS